MLKKGAFVLYTVGSHVFQAVVRRMHRDGTVTVEARHELREGKPYGCYMGYRYRMLSSDLQVEAQP